MTLIRILAPVLAALLVYPALAVEKPRVVIELFTSQGCSACPPADRLLGEFAKESDVLALTYPVTIWDHLGWHDTLATPANTRRQKAYGEARGDRRIYTPQVVVNGIKHAVGSDRSSIDNKCHAAADTAHALSVPVTLKLQGSTLKITTGNSTGDHAAYNNARLLLVVYEPELQVRVKSGENDGQSLKYINVVRALKDLGPWTPGQRLDVALPLDARAGAGLAVMIQSNVGNQPTSGIILGAASALTRPAP